MPTMIKKQKSQELLHRTMYIYHEWWHEIEALGKAKLRCKQIPIVHFISKI